MKLKGMEIGYEAVNCSTDSLTPETDNREIFPIPNQKRKSQTRSKGQTMATEEVFFYLVASRVEVISFKKTSCPFIIVIIIPKYNSNKVNETEYYMKKIYKKRLK